MVIVKRNSQEFKTIKKLFSAGKNKTEKMRTILLYFLKSSESLDDAVLLNKQKNAAALYGLAYESILNYFANSSKKLFRDEDSNVYFFKSSSSSKWIEFPFSFKGTAGKKVRAAAPIKLKIVRH